MVLSFSVITFLFALKLASVNKIYKKGSPKVFKCFNELKKEVKMLK